MLCLLLGRFGGGYTKCMTCVNVPFVLPCLEVNCKTTAAAAPERSKHWYVVTNYCFYFTFCGMFFVSIKLMSILQVHIQKWKTAKVYFRMFGVLHSYVEFYIWMQSFVVLARSMCVHAWVVVNATLWIKFECIKTMFKRKCCTFEHRLLWTHTGVYICMWPFFFDTRSWAPHVSVN